MKKIAFLGAIATTALLAVGIGTVSAEQWVGIPNKDNTIYQGAQFENNSCGAGSGIIAGRTDASNAVRRALISFGVPAAIPAGSTVTQASVILTTDRSRAANAETFNLYYLLADWGEGASNCDANAGQGALAVPPDATWINRITGAPHVPWTVPGAATDAAALPSASALVGTANGPYTFTGTRLTADVQGWIGSPSSNFGWLLLGNEAANQTAYRFSSREGADPPLLDVSFTAPDGQTPSPAYDACCLADNSCAFDTDAGCTARGGTFQTGVDVCAPSTCASDVPGACCIPAEDINFTCQNVTVTECSALGGTFQGPNEACSSCGLVPWRDPLPIPPVLQPVGTDPQGKPIYNVTMTEFTQNLHRDLPDTTVWGYNGSYPGPTIVAQQNQPIIVNYSNDLRDLNTGQLRTSHYMPVDPCPHGPMEWRDSPRTVVHLHGGHVPPRFDGNPEYDFFPGASDTYEYPNNQEPTTLWFHDHALGITRLNVTMGMAAFYLLRDAYENGLIAANQLPSGPYELGLAIQDRDFYPDGSLRYEPALDISNQMFHGSNILVNGKVWPYLNVDQGKYRLRILNGSSTRTYTISFVNVTNAARPQLPITVLATEGGFYDTPRTLANGQPITQLTLGPAERFDIVVNFGGLARNTEVIMKNSAVTDFPTGMAPSFGTQNVLKFIVGRRSGFTGAIATQLRPTLPYFEPLNQTGASHRYFDLKRVPEPCVGGEWLIQTLNGGWNGAVLGQHWDDLTEFPPIGSTEVWEFRNTSTVMHPMHIHLVEFQVVNRQAVDVNGSPTGPIIPPDPLEAAAWKDTVKAMPGQVTRVVLRFTDHAGTPDFYGRYPFHCHIIEHEDHEMMRQFQVVNLACNGNGICERGEDCVSCPGDCPAVLGSFCGNRLCELGDGENATNCSGDCAPGCGTVAAGCKTLDANLDPICEVPGFFCRDMMRLAACCGDWLCEGQEQVSGPTYCAADCANCNFTAPTVTLTPASRLITTDGGSVTYAASVLNNDSGSGCQPATYALTSADSNTTNFAPSAIAPTALTLAAGETGTATLTVTALRNQGGGVNVTTVAASAPGHLPGSASVTTTIQIGQQVSVDQLQTGTVSKSGTFTPQTTFAAGADVNVRAHVTAVPPPPASVSGATVTQQIFAPSGALVTALTSTTATSGYAIAKWRSRGAVKGTYTVRVTNVTNGVAWDGIIRTTTFTLN